MTQLLAIGLAAALAHPQIAIQATSSAALTDMIAGGFDVGIRAGEARDGTMVMREIAPLHFVVCGAPSYLAERGIPLSVADLSRHNCMRLRGRDTPSVPWRLGPGHPSEAPPISGNFLANDIAALVTAAVHGQGLVFAPLPFVLPLFRTGALRPVLPESVSQGARIFIHYVSRKHLAARVKAFVNFMLEHLRGHPDLISDPQSLLAPFVNLTGSAGTSGARIV